MKGGGNKKKGERERDVGVGEGKKEIRESKGNIYRCRIWDVIQLLLYHFFIIYRV